MVSPPSPGKETSCATRLGYMRLVDHVYVRDQLTELRRGDDELAPALGGGVDVTQREVRQVREAAEREHVAGFERDPLGDLLDALLGGEAVVGDDALLDHVRADDRGRLDLVERDVEVAERHHPRADRAVAVWGL